MKPPQTCWTKGLHNKTSCLFHYIKLLWEKSPPKKSSFCNKLQPPNQGREPEGFGIEEGPICLRRFSHNDTHSHTPGATHAH